MIFNIEGRRTKVITTTIIEDFEGEIDITKKEVMRVTGCSAKEDGDSSSWYSYVDDALQVNADCEEVDLNKKILYIKKEEVITEYEDLSTSW
jgi:hypothetical protein|tara:strand:+ start:356 stop:631 length:276 start_codon:yes stop_codon:yes gene_type:complete